MLLLLLLLLALLGGAGGVPFLLGGGDGRGGGRTTPGGHTMLAPEHEAVVQTWQARRQGGHIRNGLCSMQCTRLRNCSAHHLLKGRGAWQGAANFIAR
jgi:hypothetical protein